MSSQTPDYLEPPKPVTLEACSWPSGHGFRVMKMDLSDPHSAWYVVMPGGSMLTFNNCASDAQDEAQANWVAAKLNAALATQTSPIELPPLPKKTYMVGRAGRNSVSWGIGHSDSTLDAYAKQAVELDRRVSIKDEPNWLHPKLQSMLSQKARTSIEHRMINEVLEAETIEELEDVFDDDYETELFHKIKDLKRSVLQEPVAYLYQCKMPGKSSTYASVDSNDSQHWPIDQWKSVIRTPLVPSSPGEELLPNNAKAASGADLEIYKSIADNYEKRDQKP